MSGKLKRTAGELCEELRRIAPDHPAPAAAIISLGI